LALLRNLSTALFDKEKIRTTLMKAKELRPFAEKLVTLSKRDSLHARRRVLRHIHDRQVVAKLFDTLSARYAGRPGGYTRITKLGPRRGDHAEMALIELVASEAAAPSATAEEPAKGGRRKAASRAEGDAAPAKATKKPTKTKAAAATKKKVTRKKTTTRSAKPAAAKPRRGKRSGDGD
jgi:large subunit ribosomal protein L17